MRDTYYTVAQNTEGIYKEKGSKFIAYLHPIQTEEQLKEIVKHYKKTYYDARHHCYACILYPQNPLYKAADDGEPSHTAGTPILNQLKSANLMNVLCVVVRYFGGTKLGVPGLIHAYKTATEDAINNAKVIEKEITSVLKVQFAYPQLNDILKIQKDTRATILNQVFDNDCEITLEIRLKNSDELKERLGKVLGVLISEI